VYRFLAGWGRLSARLASMAALIWEEVVRALPEPAKERAAHWLRVQYMVAAALGYEWDVWLEEFLGPKLHAPFDYSFLEDDTQALAKALGREGDGHFSRSPTKTEFFSPASPGGRRRTTVPSNARLTEGFASGVIALMAGTTDAVPVPRSDAVALQKIFPGKGALAKLSPPTMRKLSLRRAKGHVLLLSQEGQELLRIEEGAFVSQISAAES
jgi:hypothetical protein